MATKKNMAVDNIEEIQADSEIKMESYYTAHYSKFVRSEKNLRTEENQKREELLQQIKADGGVKVPGYVYPATNNLKDPETGKEFMVIFDMNSRHWCIEQLSSDQEYLDNGGSLELPYLILDESIANDPVKERLFQISLGTSNKQLTPREQAKGYKEAIALRLEQLIDKEGDKFTNLDEEKKRIRKDKLQKKAVQEVSEVSGKTEVYIRLLLRVLDGSEQNPILAQAIEDEIISIRSTDNLLVVANKYKENPDIVLDIASKAAKARGKNKISDVDIEKASSIVENNEAFQLVKEGILPVTLVDDAVKLANDAKIDLKGLVYQSVDEGGVTLENLKDVHNALSEDSEEFTNEDEETAKSDVDSEDDSENDSEDESKEMYLERLEYSKEVISSFAITLAELSENFENLPEDFIVIIADKFEKMEKQIQSKMKKNESSSDKE